VTEVFSAGALRGAARIERGGSVLLDGAYGEDGSGTRLTTGTAFQIASISKSFTAACVLRLVDQGRLSLDDLLSRFLDSTPPDWRDIAIHHLLTHTGGLAHWQDVAGHDHYRQVPRDELIASFAATPMKSEPGGGWSYSSLGYVLLAHVVEVVAGEPYPSVLEREVLQPLGLRHTRAGEAPDGVPAARGSRRGREARSFDLSVNVGTGDVWSTTGDLARWPRALASFAPSVFAPQAPVPDEQTALADVGYGYGWFTASLAGERVVFHPGDQSGFTSLLVWAPEADLVLVVLAADEVKLQTLALPALTALLDAS
jgi:CubicO group peptidase (beta-lactamase class C family)